MRPSRRRLLAGVGSGLAAGLAGCAGLLSSDPGDESDGATHEDAWPSFQRGPANTGHATTASAPTDDPTERWRVSLPGAVGHQVAVASVGVLASEASQGSSRAKRSDGVRANVVSAGSEGDRREPSGARPNSVSQGSSRAKRSESAGGDAPTVFATTDAGTVHALDAASGEQRWSASVDGGRGHCPAVADGLVLVGSDTGALVALEADTGDRAWSRTLEGPVAGPTVADGTAYVGTGAGTAHAVALDGGEVAWTADLDHPAAGYPAVDDDTVYVGAETPATLQGSLHVLDRASGEEQWSAEGSRTQPPTISDGRVVVPMLGVRVYTPSGFRRREFGFGGHVIASVAATPDATFAGSTGSRFGRFSRDGGRPTWNVDVGVRATDPPAVTDEAVYLTGSNRVVALGVDTGETLWSTSVGGEFARSPTVADGAVFVGTDVGDLVCLE